MGQFGMGQPVRRVEDQRFITGTGQYTDDIALPGMAYALMLRSPHAHARIRSIDTAAARALPGVLDIITAAEVAEAGLGPIKSIALPSTANGKPMVQPPRLLLATDRVRHVGDGVAMIVADSLAVAREAAELVEIDYADEPAIVDLAQAVGGTAATGHIATVYAEAPDNRCFIWANGDQSATDAAFARADRVVRLTLVNQRLVSNALEPRNAIGAYQEGSYTLYTSSQGVHDLRDGLAEDVFRIDPARIRVVTTDVGGGFGTKIFLYPEQALVLLAAQRIGRPVKWTGDRSDSFQADAHGRDNLTTAELALDRNGKFLALRVETLANLGAYLSPYGPFVATLAGTRMLTGLYDIPAAHVTVHGVFTHTAPVDAYRGAGRPEAAYVIERLVDAAARATGIDRAELRRRNFIPPERLPGKTAFGMPYDSGEFAALMDRALAVADRDGFATRKQDSARRGLLRGFGFATYIEACAGGSAEAATLSFDADGTLTIAIGTQSNGQGHATAYAQLAADRLGIDVSAIRTLQGDTAKIATGGGTGGSRSVPTGGAAVDVASLALIEKGKALAAHQLEAAAGDIEFAEGRYRVAGTDLSLTIQEVARRAAAGDVPEGEAPGLAADGRYKPPAATFPNGCHVVEVEIDPDTGATRIDRYTVVDDFGATVNPLLLAGQVHGGIAQGVGQALLEECRYDPETGQLISGSFMDYAMPRADLLPDIRFETRNVPCRTNPLGIKGAGEAGTIGATPAVMNAVLDALADAGIDHLDMPATPHRIWQALHAARTAQAAE